MEEQTSGVSVQWPLGVLLNSVGGENNGTVNVGTGLTILVGPNGSGKTRALRAIKTTLEGTNRIASKNRKVRFLSAGRSSPFEPYRASVNGPHNRSETDAAVGEQYYKDSWWHIESMTGDLMALDARADLKLKVEARLKQLLDRNISLTWSQSGLSPRIISMRDGSSYSANHEASGILQLVALLAAIHNDEIGALIVDEPEISLHPQHQAFVLEEMERVAGDPEDPTKKLIVFATHAPTLLPLRSELDLPSFAFFNDIKRPPAQISVSEPMLKSTKLKSLIARLSATHRMAVFAERVLLVEGPSDETIVTQLAHTMGWPLLARNAQVLPVTGKGEFIEVAKLFRLMNKRFAILADLDALADDNGLVNFFSTLPEAAEIANQKGAESIAALDGDLRSKLADFISKHQVSVDQVAQVYPNWSNEADEEVTRKRVTLARLLTSPDTFGGEAVSDAKMLSNRYKALLEMLESAGCFFLRAGAIENYYPSGSGGGAKPSAAADVAATFGGTDHAILETQYSDVLGAIKFIAPARGVDENRVLRPKLGAAISAIFQSMTPTSTTGELESIAKDTIGFSAEVFGFKNVSTEDHLKIKVEIASNLFPRDNFPVVISHGQNINTVLPDILPFVDET